MPKVIYTDINNNKYSLDLTKRGIGKFARPTLQELNDFYENYIKPHDPAAAE
jgi:hypothetical protein|tara:strand:- start:289 stop:444 length:156 start_codon:yes stop_codon:yes gene_type:complete